MNLINIHPPPVKRIVYVSNLKSHVMLDKDMFDKDMVCHYTGKNEAISILREKQINFSLRELG